MFTRTRFNKRRKSALWVVSIGLGMLALSASALSAGASKLPLAPTAHPSAASNASTTYYVRVDGGSSDECDGRHDVAYAGKGKKQPCAWRHPFDALPPGGPARISGGDTLIIAAGSYRMGRGAPGSDAMEKCRADWPWDCHLTALPSGPTTDRPTRVLGAGWDHGCAMPPQLWGTDRANTVLDLDHSSNIQIACLELTDHASCVEFHGGTREVNRCQRDQEPIGAWAAVGIRATDSTNVQLSDLNVHGLAHDGIRAGRLHDWTLDRVRIVGNGWSGWNGDVGQNSSDSGRMLFHDVEIAWNGCGETYPGGKPVGCWGQEEGGYGDGLGTGASSGEWVFDHVNVHHNTQDGLDLLHVNADATVIFRDVHAEGNAGNQLKAGGSVRVENSIVIGTCRAMSGLGSLSASDLCRAFGNSLSLHPAQQNHIDIVHNQISGEGDCLIDMECAGPGCQAATATISDNRLIGLPDRSAGHSRRASCSVWVEPQLRGAKIQFSRNDLYSLRTLGCPAGIDECDGNTQSSAAPENPLPK